MRYRTALLSCFAVVLSVVVAAQTYPLSEVEVRLVHNPHGCFGPCVQYTIAVGGGGTVEYNGVRPVEAMRSRKISSDEVVALVNAFLEARFFDDALDTYRNPPPTLVRKGDTVMLYGAVGASDTTQTDLTLRIGDRQKTVTFYENY